MALRDAAAIDKNFDIRKKINKPGIAYRNADELDVYGLKKIDGIYRRMRLEDAMAVSENVALISSESAGGRVRFITNSPYIAILAKYRSVAKVSNYSFTATCGFDLYSGKRFVGCYVPPFDTTNTYEGIIELKNEGKPCEYTLNFPVCSEIEELFVGVDENSVLTKAQSYSITSPVVFYGSSTTQGACASRPGNTYENMVSRALDCDYINLGFWGNARGEAEMASYIASLKMSAFVYDYDYNAPSAEHLEATHEKMFKIVREKHPALPIIILSAPKYYLDTTDKKRLEIIKQTYLNAIAAADANVRFISGPEMLETVRDTALADNIHPGDNGFLAIASSVGKALKELLTI